MGYYVYILSNKKNGVLYIGVTNNLERRIIEHKHGSIKGFTKRYNVNRLVRFEKFQHIKEALDREKQLKNWKRERKIYVIEKENSNRDDLFSRIE